MMDILVSTILPFIFLTLNRAVIPRLGLTKV